MGKRNQTNTPTTAPAANPSTQVEPCANQPNIESGSLPSGKPLIGMNDMNQLNGPDPANVSEDSAGECDQADERERLVSELADVQADIHFLKRREARLQEQLDALTEEEEQADDPHANTKNIQAYIRRQNAIRQGEEIPQSPLDAAMVRRRGHGLNRPVFPVKS